MKPESLRNLMDELVESGASARQMAIVGEIVATCLESIRSNAEAKLAAKKEYDRTYRRESRTTSYDQKEAPHTPQEKNIYILPRAIDPSWKPSSNAFDYGKKLGFSAAEIEGCAEEMRIWALTAGGKNTKKKDWDLTFLGWMRREAKNRKPRKPTSGLCSSPQFRPEPEKLSTEEWKKLRDRA